MNSVLDRMAFFRARRSALLWTLAAVFSIAKSPAALASDPKEPAPPPEKPGDPGAPRTSIIRSGVLQTREGLTLRLKTDLGSVNVTQLEPGASPVVRYTVHVETDARGAADNQLLSNYYLEVGQDSSGVGIDCL